jgi:hypothetical protein
VTNSQSASLQTALLEVDPNFKEVVSDGVVRRHMLVPTKRVREGTANSENLSNGQLPKLIDGSDFTAAMLRVRPQRPAAADLPQPVPAASTAPLRSGGRSQSSEPASTAGPPLQSAMTAADAAARAVPVLHLPRYAHWFRFDQVSDIERNGNVDFFNGSSPSRSEASYREIRNFMVNKYRENPKQKLSLLECRNLLQGDASAIQRVWRFLEAWGLINYQLPLQQVRHNCVRAQNCGICCQYDTEVTVYFYCNLK